MIRKRTWLMLSAIGTAGFMVALGAVFNPAAAAAGDQNLWVEQPTPGLCLRMPASAPGTAVMSATCDSDRSRWTTGVPAGDTLRQAEATGLANPETGQPAYLFVKNMYNPARCLARTTATTVAVRACSSMSLDQVWAVVGSLDGTVLNLRNTGAYYAGVDTRLSVTDREVVQLANSGGYVAWHYGNPDL